MTYRVRYERLMGELPPENDIGEISVICPFHEDHKRSASLNITKGLFHCMACQSSHNWKSFRKAWQEEFGDERPPSPRDNGGLVRVKAIPDETVRDLHFELMKNQQPVLDRLREERGLTLEVIREMQIGWHTRTNRVAIPIRDENNVCVNIRLYSFDESGSQKMISWKAGYGAARLWPLDALTHDKYVILAEGEMDCMILRSFGLNSITSTAGAKTWKNDWSEKFAGLKVYICYDSDSAGAEGANKAAKFLVEHAAEVRVVDLDLSRDGEDITDFFIHYGYGPDDLKEAVKLARVYKSRDQIAQADDGGEIEWVTLGGSLQGRHRSENVMIPVIVNARRDERSHYPKLSEINCTRDAGKLCKMCPLYSTGFKEVEIQAQSELVTRFVGVRTDQQDKTIRALAGVPHSCPKAELNVIESGTIEEVLLSPEVDTEDTPDDLYLIQRGFYVGLGLDYNASYVVRAKPIPFWKTSKVVHQIIDATPSHDSIESFEMTEQIYEQLAKFKAEPGGAKRKLGDIARNLQDNVTRIWDRLDLHVAMDLVWHSVLEFEFDDALIRRGWLECCVVGDTRTGKSEIAHNLQRFYGLGEVVSGENSSYAGLVGGAVQIDSAWFVKWGRLPLNDRRLVVVDEVTGLTPEEIGQMSGIRETGIAEITKIETQKAKARCRSVWIGNVRPPRRDLGDFDFGCEALVDLIGMPEDIARFDYATSAAAHEVNARTVNSPHPNLSAPWFSGEDGAQLILWAWSRGRDTVQFQHEAIQACWKHAVEMGEAYTSDIPLVLAANQRIKLARVAAAIAARLFSTNDGEYLIVTKEHVDVARWLLDKLYSKPSFGYAQMSGVSLQMERLQGESENRVLRFLKTRPRMVEYLGRTSITNKQKLADMVGLTDEEAQAAIRFLTSTMMLADRGQHGYRVTPELKSLMRTMNKSDFDLED